MEASSWGRMRWMLSTTPIMLVPGWRWMFSNTAGVDIDPSGLFDVLRAVDHGRHVREPDRGAIAVSNDDRACTRRRK